jgi:hypothetical protein
MTSCQPGCMSKEGGCKAVGTDLQCASSTPTTATFQLNGAPVDLVHTQVFDAAGQLLHHHWKFVSLGVLHGEGVQLPGGPLVFYLTGTAVPNGGFAEMNADIASGRITLQLGDGTQGGELVLTSRTGSALAGNEYDRTFIDPRNGEMWRYHDDCGATTRASGEHAGKPEVTRECLNDAGNCYIGKIDKEPCSNGVFEQDLRMTACQNGFRQVRRVCSNQSKWGKACQGLYAWSIPCGEPPVPDTAPEPPANFDPSPTTGVRSSHMTLYAGADEVEIRIVERRSNGVVQDTEVEITSENNALTGTGQQAGAFTTRIPIQVSGYVLRQPEQIDAFLVKTDGTVIRYQIKDSNDTTLVSLTQTKDGCPSFCMYDDARDGCYIPKMSREITMGDLGPGGWPVSNDIMVPGSHKCGTNSDIVYNSSLFLLGGKTVELTQEGKTDENGTVVLSEWYLLTHGEGDRTYDNAFLTASGVLPTDPEEFGYFIVQGTAVGSPDQPKFAQMSPDVTTGKLTIALADGSRTITLDPHPQFNSQLPPAGGPPPPMIPPPEGSDMEEETEDETDDDGDDIPVAAGLVYTACTEGEQQYTLEGTTYKVACDASKAIGTFSDDYDSHTCQDGIHVRSKACLHYPCDMTKQEHKYGPCYEYGDDNYVTGVQAIMAGVLCLGTGGLLLAS